MTSTAPSPPPFARWAVLPIAAAVAVVQLVAATRSGYWFDEVYMLAIGRNHLDWGSADQPPMTPALAWLMDAIAPGSVLALRLPAVLATTAAVVVAALIARELGGDRRAQAMTAGVQATALWITLAGHWLTPYTLEPVQWLLLLWLLIRWIRLRDDRLLLALGAVAGIAAMTKFQVVLLCAALLLSVLLLGPRELLARPLLWAGVGIAGLLAAPTLVWQAVHGWPQLRMSGIVIAEAEALYGGRPGVAFGMIAVAGLAGTVLSLYGLWRLARADELRFLALTTALLYALFVIAPGRPYYLGGLYAVLAAAGALGLQRRREAGRGRRRWVAWPAFALSAALAAGILTLPVADVSDRMGDALARRAADVYHALPPEQRERTALIGDPYIAAAYLDGYSTRYDLPPAHSTNRGYGYFPPPPESADAAVYVGADPDELRPYFTDAHLIAAGTPTNTVWLVTGRHTPWTRVWTDLRTLDVEHHGTPPR
ncbi:glycosyltransferase family 39 protein [Saccharopolyspora cebuensis]|uniref:Glycosyltransferase family 39 protein n=1 Tax=Saccharopolyspora cebuensis TaxID=418759 RepID=A0ABV4CM02_9PSEU